MVVDTHVHVVAEDQRKYPRQVSGANTEWIQDTSGEKILSLMREAGIDRTMLVQAYGAYRYDNSYAADCGAAHPDRFLSVCIVDPLQSDAPDKLTYWVKERCVRGMRLFNLTEPAGNWLDNPRTFPLWERAASLGIPLCVCTRFHDLPRLRPALERFPGVPLALDHLGLPRLDDGPPYDALKPLFEMARLPNVYLKFSSVSMYAARRGRSTPRELFQRLLEQFGAHRMMWGSNFPATNDRSLKAQLELAQEELSFAPEEDQRWLFGEAALTLWPMLR